MLRWWTLNATLRRQIHLHPSLQNAKPPSSMKLHLGPCVQRSKPLFICPIRRQAQLLILLHFRRPHQRQKQLKSTRAAQKTCGAAAAGRRLCASGARCRSGRRPCATVKPCGRYIASIIICAAPSIIMYAACGSRISRCFESAPQHVESHPSRNLSTPIRIYVCALIHRLGRRRRCGTRPARRRGAGVGWRGRGRPGSRGSPGWSGPTCWTASAAPAAARRGRSVGGGPGRGLTRRPRAAENPAHPGVRYAVAIRHGLWPAKTVKMAFASRPRRPACEQRATPAMCPKGTQ